MRASPWLFLSLVAGCSGSTVAPTDGGAADASMAVDASARADAGTLAVVDLATWKGTTCAVLSDGHVACWGDNSSGQLGDGTRSPAPSLVTVAGVTGATQILAGGIYSCALLAGGAVSCWGSLGTPGAASLPTFVGMTEIDGDFRELCGLTTAGTLICTDEMPALTGVAQLALGDASRCVRLSDGSVECWGMNTEGELGDVTTMPHAAPAPVPGLGGVTDLASGQFHRCAIRSGPTGAGARTVTASSATG